MKRNTSFLIQILVAVILISSWFIYENQQDDKIEYQAIISQSSSNRRAIEIITRSSQGLIQGAERMIEKSPDQKPLVEVMRETEGIIGDFYDFIRNIRVEVSEYNEDDFKDWDSEKPKIIMPIGYNSTKRVKLVFKENDTLYHFEKKWQEVLEKLKELHSKSIRKRLNLEVLSDSTFNDYSQKQALIIKENTPLLHQLIEQKELRNIIFKYDVVHADALLLAIQSELKSLEWALLYNTAGLIYEEKSHFASIIMMEMEGAPIVGEPVKFQFYPAAYGVTDDMEIRLNGKSYEVKDGIATFNYTPKSSGTKYFKVDISLKNPFTGKTDRFSDTKKVEVFE